MSARDVLKALVLVILDQIDETTGEGIHTALRKACTSTAAGEAWDAIRRMPRGEWSNACTWATGPHRNLWLDENVAALEAALSAAGYAVVPREPTEAMLDAAFADAVAWLSAVDTDNTDCKSDRARSAAPNASIYRAMLAATEADHGS